MDDVQWIWSERKNSINLEKHRIPFEIAQRVFDDPLHLSEPDSFEQEERWLTYGRIRGVLVVVVHTEPIYVGEDRKKVGRIISARKALKHEQRLVEQAIYGNR